VSDQYIISIIICTYNRADDLRQTLAAVAQVCVPEQMPTELLVVDNASTDVTAEVVASCHLPNMPVRYIHEPRRGKGYAYNTGMAAARGEVFLFTDDDVRPPKNWIEGMCGPILRGEADAVAGGVTIAPHLERAWFSPTQRGWLAELKHPRWERMSQAFLVGANMAFSRNVLEKVPAFDPELGPGATGFGDDGLFGLQLQGAGFSVYATPEANVEHHFAEDRLLRRNFLSIAQRMGRTDAYLAHHWQHRPITLPHLRLVKHWLHLTLLRIIKRKECHSVEGMPAWEMVLLQKVSLYRQYLIERKRLRTYKKHGLVKRTVA